MTTVNQNFITRIGGINFFSSNSYTGEAVATINGDVAVTTGDTTLPLYVEDSTEGDIKLIVIKSSAVLDKFDLQDSAGNTKVDLVTHLGENFAANTVYQFPGTKALPTFAGDDDIQKLVISSTGSATASLEVAVLYNIDASDTVTDHS